MKKTTNRMEELFSRREFFKKTAQTALPILGAIILAGNPMIAKAVETEPMGCNSGCTATCSGTCKGTCRSCAAGCSKSCMSGCTGCRKGATK